MATLVPMPEGVILHPRLIADRRHWLDCLRIGLRVKWEPRRPISSLRECIWRVNHGTRHNGRTYRQCYRFDWAEKRPAEEGRLT